MNSEVSNMASYSVEDMRRRAKLVEYLDMPDERFLLLSKDTQNSLVINLLKVKVEDLSKENSERVASLKLKTLYDYTRHSWINIKSETFVLMCCLAVSSATFASDATRRLAALCS